VKRRLLSLARQAHIPPPLYPPKRAPTPPPQEALAEPQDATERVEDFWPTPEPKPERKPKPEPPVRVVYRTRKWFDADRLPFDQMTF
jgi:hypothetical protein